jgi:transposase-like protein
LDRFGIEKESPEPKWRDEETLRKLYWDEGLSSIQIAKKLGCTKPVILNWMKRFGIERRKENKDKLLAPFTNKEGYEVVSSSAYGGDKAAYIHKLVAIAEYGWDAVDGKLVHHENEIKWDNRPENLTPLTRREHNVVHGGDDDTPWTDKEKLVDALEKYSQNELADRWGCNQSMISRWRKRHGLRD